MTNWQPILPIQSTEHPGGFPEFDRLHAEYRLVPKSSNARKQATTSAMRRWSIENGVIENIYSLTPAATALLEDHGLDFPIHPDATNIGPELLASILSDHAAAFDIAHQQGSHNQPITRTAIRQLHQALVAHQTTYRATNQFGQWFDAAITPGAFKTMPNNPTRADGAVHHYCPPEHVDSEIDQLLAWNDEYFSKPYHPMLVSAWFHHRFTQIHPFQDGNGRVSRALQNWQLAQHYLPAVVVDRYNRDEYITALEEADAGHLSPLIQFNIDNLADTMVRTITAHQASIRPGQLY